MSQISLTIANRPDYNIEVIDYSVSKEATPLAPGDSSGSVGGIRATIMAKKDGPHRQRTSTILDMDITLADREPIEFTAYRGRGAIQGHVTKNVEPGVRATLTADTLLSRLNTDRDAGPVFGARRTGNIVTYVVNGITNPSSEVDLANYTAVGGTGGTVGLTRVNTAGLPLYGSWVARAAWTVAATTPGGIVYTSAVTPNSGLTFSGYARVSGTKTTQSLRIEAQFYDNTATPVGSLNLGSAQQVGATGYTRLSVFGVAPSNAVSVQLRFYNVSTGLPGMTFSNWANGDILLIDGLMATLGTTLYEYFDGTFPASSWTGTAHASTSQIAVTTPIDEGFDATVANAFRYYCGLVGIEESAIQIDGEFEGVPVAYPAWSGNVWNHLKMLGVAVGGEIDITDSGSVVFRRPRKHVIVHENIAGLVRSVDSQATALAVELFNYNNQWLVDGVAFTGTTVYSVDVNTSTVADVRVPHSLTRVNSPQPTSVLPEVATYVGPGAYIVMDSDDVIVDPATWTNLRGSVSAELVPETYDTIRIVITGPGEAGLYKAPFRIGFPTAFSDIPALIITGEGVFTNKEITRVSTAATLTQTSTETAPTIDNPFISNAAQAADRSILAAMRASGPAVTIEGNVTYDRASNGRDFEQFVGGRIKYDSNIYRVKSATFRSAGIDFSAEADVIFGDVTEAYSITFEENNQKYAGQTFATHNALFTGQTFTQAMSTVPQPTFAEVNALYAGFTFNDHAIYPLITKSTTDWDTNAEARF